MPSGFGVPKFSKTVSKKVRKAPQNPFSDFFKLFGPFSRHFWTFGTRPRETFSRLSLRHIEIPWTWETLSQVHGTSICVCVCFYRQTSHVLVPILPSFVLLACWRREAFEKREDSERVLEIARPCGSYVECRRSQICMTDYLFGNLCPLCCYVIWKLTARLKERILLVQCAAQHHRTLIPIRVTWLLLQSRFLCPEAKL